MNHEAAFDLLADFALDLLDPDEAAEVRSHVEACARCRAELQQFLQAADALALASEDVPLPVGAAERIAAGVRDRTAASAPAPAAPAPGPVAGRVIMGPWRGLALASAAAVLLMAVGLTAVSIAWLDARDDVDRLEGQLAARAIELPLSGDGASGAIYVAHDFGSGVARFVGLEEAPAQHHYKLWSEGPYGTRAAADFMGEDGELLVQLPELPREMTRMFVTIEPDGTAGAVPTGPEVLSTPR